MLLIQCPWCGERAESEFNYGGEAGIVRPVRADSQDRESWLDDTRWGDYVFMRKNTRGVFREQWVHTHGCRRWFEAERDTVTHRFLGFYRMGEAPASAGGPASDEATPSLDATASSGQAAAASAGSEATPAVAGAAHAAPAPADASATTPSTTSPSAAPATGSSQGAA